MRRYSEAADVLLHLAPSDDIELAAIENAARLLRRAPDAVPSSQSLPKLGGLEWVYSYIGALDRRLDNAEFNIAAGYSRIFLYYWHPSNAPMRKTERFKTYLRNVGLVDYWRAKGWPALCHPVGADDFACE
jgi:hypothetical protein